jgi:hypothetical protein
MLEQTMCMVIETYEFGVTLEVPESDVKLERLLDTTMKRLLGLTHSRSGALDRDDHRHEGNTSTTKYGPNGHYRFDS